MNFKDKVVVITGGTSGIGKQAAIEFSRKGAHVVAFTVDKEEVCKEATKEIGNDASYIHCDVSKEEDVKKLSIRKFWRYVKRISKRDVFNVMKTAETSGMVKLKEPVEYWMSDIEINDKYKEVKTDTQSLQKMISG